MLSSPQPPSFPRETRRLIFVGRRQTCRRCQGGAVSPLAVQGGDGCGSPRRSRARGDGFARYRLARWWRRRPLARFRRVLRRPLVRRVLPDLHAEIGRTRDLAAAVDRLQSATAPLLLSCSAAPSNAASCAAASIPKRAADRDAAPLCWHSIVIRGVTNDVYLDRLTAATLPAPRALQKPRLANRFAALHILGVVAV